MIHQIAIPKEIYKDEAVQFIAGRYHTSTENVVACYIGQVEEEQDSLTKNETGFMLEDNEVRLIHDLIIFYNK